MIYHICNTNKSDVVKSFGTQIDAVAYLKEVDPNGDYLFYTTENTLSDYIPFHRTGNWMNFVSKIGMTYFC